MTNYYTAVEMRTVVLFAFNRNGKLLFSFRAEYNKEPIIYDACGLSVGYVGIFTAARAIGGIVLTPSMGVVPALAAGYFGAFLGLVIGEIPEPGRLVPTVMGCMFLGLRCCGVAWVLAAVGACRS